MKRTYWKLLGQLLKAPRETPKKPLTSFKIYDIMNIESEVNTMVEIIEFVLMNAESIESYEVVDYSMDATIVEFTMVNGEKKVLMG